MMAFKMKSQKSMKSLLELNKKVRNHISLCDSSPGDHECLFQISPDPTNNSWTVAHVNCSYEQHSHVTTLFKLQMFFQV